MAKEMTVVKGKITAKAGTGKGFKLEGVDGWLSAQKEIIPELAKIDKGSVVEVSYSVNGTWKNVSKIVVVSAPVASAPAAAKEDPKQPAEVKKTYGSGYGSAEDVTGKEVGCAIGVAGSLLAGIAVNEEDDEKIMERFRKVTKEVLDYMRVLKSL